MDAANPIQCGNPDSALKDELGCAQDAIRGPVQDGVVRPGAGDAGDIDQS